MPTRPILWNVDDIAQAAMYLLLVLPAFFLAYGIARRYLIWRAGRPYRPVGEVSRRVKAALGVALLHRRILRPGYVYAGIMHLFVFWGFVVLFIGTVLVMLQADITDPYLGWKFLHGAFYVVYKLALNTFGFLFIAGLLMAIYRRYVQAPPKFKVSLSDDAAAVGSLLLLGLTGFLLQALRLAAAPSGDPSADYAPVHWVSYPFSLLLDGLSQSKLEAIHTATWWFHMALTMAFLAYLAYSKMFHIFGAPANIFMRAAEPVPALASIPNIEEVDSLGAGEVTGFNWKQLINFDACMRCGRCLDFCPTYNTGKPLKPRQLIVEIGAFMARSSPGPASPLFGEIAVQGHEAADNGNPGANGLGPAAQLIGDVVSEAEIWDCTTCRACMEQCPVLIEHVPLIVEMRRSLVDGGRVPGIAARALESLNALGNPWGHAPATRTDWAGSTRVPVLTEGAEIDVLWWVGCAGSWEPVAQQTSRAMASLLDASGIKYAILGSQERCCGSEARRLGEEGLFEKLAGDNIRLFESCGVKKIVVTCPHCYNTFKNEYPDLGGVFEVLHHSEFLSGLVNDGKLKLTRQASEQISFHDSCYLGRYNGLYDPPRELLGSIPGMQLAEMPRNRERGFCCGGGGGQMWLEGSGGERINYARLREAEVLKVQTLATACPFCKVMLDDAAGHSSSEDKIRVKDIAELILEAE